MREQIGDMTLYYETMGEGKPMLMLHGWPLDHAAMIGAMEAILSSRAGWKRIYVDLPGMGQSDAPEWLKTQDQVLEVVEGFIEKIIPGERFCAAGLSYGGLLAQGLVYHLGDRMNGVMFLVPGMASIDRENLPKPVVMHEETVDFGSLNQGQIDSFKGMAVAQTQAHLDAWKAYIIPGVERAKFAFLDNLQVAYSFDVEKPPQPFRAPALFLMGRQDSSVGYRDAWRIIENYPHASFVILDRAGHCLQMEQPKLYETLVHEWLDRVEEYIRKGK
jgi:pimeloyl-ACP methyl ester carboxylesterase